MHYREEPTSGGRICASFVSCCCSSATQEPPTLCLVSLYPQLGQVINPHKLYSGQITVLPLQTKWNRSLVAKIQCTRSCSKSDSFLFIQGLTNLLLTDLKWLTPLSVCRGRRAFHSLQKTELPCIITIMKRKSSFQHFV